MKMLNHIIGYGQTTFIIAEACSNIVRHIRDANTYECVEKVAQSGADAIKAQLYRADHFTRAERAAKRLTEFPRELFADFVQFSHQNGLAVGASVFDLDAVTLCEDAGADFLKLATREFGNKELENRCDESSLPIFQSFDVTKYASRHSFPDWIYLACAPEYPAINPGVPFFTDNPYGMGWSSHTPDWLDCLIAVSRDACVIEKHIAFHDDDPERGWSLAPPDFKRMVEDIRRVERMR